MGIIRLHNEKPVHLTLAVDRIRSIRRGHPWIFSESLVELPPAPPGSLAVLKDKRGEILAKGFYDPGCRIALRLCTTRERLDDGLLRQRLQAAAKLRARLFDPQVTNGYRLVNGEGDELPGLVIDVYGKHAVIKLDGAGPAGFYDVQEVADEIVREVGVKAVCLKHKAGGPERATALVGELPARPVLFMENGVTFEADLVQGQKTGFFLDQRENRAHIRPLARRARVLNVFGYTGGFSVYAGLGGASHVTTVDIAAPALEGAAINWSLNGLDPYSHEGIAADAFAFFKDAKSAKEMWDVVIVDPPSFAPSAAAVTAAQAAYIRLFAAAAAVTAPGGVLAMASCSSHITAAAFSEICVEAVSQARRTGVVLGVHGQPSDHPFPIACSELQYLKFTIFRL